MSKVAVRSRYNYEQRAVSDVTGLDTGSESKVIQSAKDEADINVLVRRFGIVGQVTQGTRMPLTGDFTNVGSFQDCLNAVRSAQESFEAMPAEVRAEFLNNPAQFVKYCTERDSKGALVNLERMRSLGLAVPAKEIPPEPKPMKVEVINPKDGSDKKS